MVVDEGIFGWPQGSLARFNFWESAGGNSKNCEGALRRKVAPLFRSRGRSDDFSGLGLFSSWVKAGSRGTSP